MTLTHPINVYMPIALYLQFIRTATYPLALLIPLRFSKCFLFLLHGPLREASVRYFEFFPPFYHSVGQRSLTHRKALSVRLRLGSSTSDPISSYLEAIGCRPYRPSFAEQVLHFSLIHRGTLHALRLSWQSLAHPANNTVDEQEVCHLRLSSSRGV